MSAAVTVLGGVAAAAADLVDDADAPTDGAQAEREYTYEQRAHGES